MSDAPHRLVIVEDDPTVRAYLLQTLAAEPRFDVIAIAPDIRTGRTMLALEPELFLLDIGLPDGNGYDLVPAIKETTGAKVLILSAFGDKETVIRSLRAGADGYLLKDSPPAILIDGLLATLDGGAPISPAAAAWLLGTLRDEQPDSPTDRIDADPALQRLSQREAELLRAFARGESYKEAARTLGISPLTVGNHVKSIYRKLEVNSRSEAIRAGRMAGEI